MSQRVEYIKDEVLTITLELKVKIDCFSNHDGFKEKQIENAIDEFKENITNEIKSKIINEYYQQEFLQSVDFVSYQIKE